jgi:hypothetical protein
MKSSARTHLGSAPVESTRTTRDAIGPASPFSSDPRTAREQRIAETAAALRHALDTERASFAVVAAWLGLSESELKRCSSPTSGRHLSLADAAGLPPAVLRRVLVWLAEPLGLAVVEVPESSGPVDLGTLAAATRETSDVVASALDHHARGHMTRAEGAVLARECDEAISVLLSIREQAMQAQREGVVGLVSTRGVA